MIWRGRSIGEQNGGIKRLVIYCWVRGLSFKYICIYGVLSDSVSPQFQLEWDHWVLGAPAPWGAISWSLCPVWRCQCAPPAGLVFACRAAERLGARYWGSHKAGRDRAQKVCQLAERGTHRSRPASAGTIRSHMFVCGVCARGTSHCDNGLLSMSAVVEPSTRSPLCSLCLLEVHTQPLSWPELGMWNLTFTELLESATHEPFGWSLCAWLSSFSAVFWVWLRIVQGRFWIYLTCPLGSLQISVQKKFIC